MPISEVANTAGVAIFRAMVIFSIYIVVMAGTDSFTISSFTVAEGYLTNMRITPVMGMIHQQAATQPAGNIPDHHGRDD